MRTITNLINARLAKAGLRPTAIARKRVEGQLIDDLKISEHLLGLSDELLFNLSRPKKDGDITSKS